MHQKAHWVRFWRIQKKLGGKRRGKSVLAHTMRVIENKILDCEIKKSEKDIIYMT